MRVRVCAGVFTHPAEMMPHEIIEYALGHALRPQVAHVQLLITPLDPSRLRGHAVYQAQCVNFLRMGECESRQNVGAGTDPETNYGLDAKVAENEEQLFRELLHGRIGVAETKSRPFQITYRLDNSVTLLSREFNWRPSQSPCHLHCK